MLHHKTHTHPFLGPVAGRSLSLTTPYPEDRLAAPVTHLELRLTATDSKGLSVTATQELHPRLSLGLSRVGLRPGRFRDDGSLPRLRPPGEPGDGLDLRLSAPAGVTLSIERGERRSGCKGDIEDCLEFVPQSGRATLNAPAGASTIAFRGRVTSESRPGPGLYRARLVAKDRWGRRSQPRTARFELLRP